MYSIKEHIGLALSIIALIFILDRLHVIDNVKPPTTTTTNCGDKHAQINT